RPSRLASSLLDRGRPSRSDRVHPSSRQGIRELPGDARQSERSRAADVLSRDLLTSTTQDDCAFDAVGGWHAGCVLFDVNVATDLSQDGAPPIGVEYRRLSVGTHRRFVLWILD